MWGLAALERVFVRERDEAIAHVGARRQALELYAVRSLHEGLERRLRRAGPETSNALVDALAPADHLVLVDRGQQQLPRRFDVLPGDETPGEDLVRLLVSGEQVERRVQAAAPGSPWRERLALFATFREAVRADDASAIEGSVRAILAHRLHYRLDTARDLPLTLALLEVLQRESHPEPALVRGLLRDGIPDGRGERIPDLFRALLEHRHRFTRADLQALAARMSRVAERSAVPFQDLLDRVQGETGEPLDLPEDLRGPTLWGGGAWYLGIVDPATETVGPDFVRGVRIDFEPMLDRVRQEMEDRGLLEAGDSLGVAGGLGPEVALDGLDLGVRSPRWAIELRAIDDRYRLKTGLVLLCGSLAAAMVLLALAYQRRRHRLVEIQTEFVAAVSHELRTPLAAIRVLAETLERRLGDDPRARGYPGRIVRAIDSLSFLVENILSFNRLERGRIEPRLADVDLAELVTFLRSELEGHELRETRVETENLDGAVLRADPDLMRVLFLNLGRNACLYNERDPIEIRVEAEAPETANGRLRVRFRDNGWGLPDSDREKVFAEFHRAAASPERSVPGTGLGLSICRRIMTLHGGTIRVADSDDRGTAFELEFPRAA